MSYNNDWDKLLILEACPGKQLNDFNWINDSTPSAPIELDYMEYSTNTLARAAYVAVTTEPTGGTITTSGTKRIHKFTSSGTFALPSGVSGNVEVLVVGGGGGGGRNNLNAAGGGGGGGVQYSASLALSAGESVAVTVGTGGAGGNATNDPGDNGTDSVFKTLTATGGGGGGANSVGTDGGCGGGGSGTTSSLAGGTGSQGGNGGTGYGSGTALNRAGGGGGGGSPDDGDNAASATGGNGGAGYASSITGVAVNYAGGGGGSARSGTQGTGVDGGGNGSNSAAGGAGTDGLGSGGGGACNDYNGGDGGDGVVIISYVRNSFKTFDCYSEATIKNQGSYSLKGIAVITGSLNQTLTRTVSPTIDLSRMTEIKFDIRASRTGSNLKIGIHDAGGTTTEITPNILVANTWQTVTWDISAVADANKDAIDKIIITIVNADAANTFYVDNIFAENYPVFYTDLAIGEITKVEENGTVLSKKTSLATVATTAGSFYHDFFGGRLYVRLALDDSPGSFISPDYVYDIIAFIWKCISNRQGENGSTISYVLEDCTYPVLVEPALKAGTLSSLTASIADHFESAMQTAYGNISIVNDLGRWYAEIDDWYWSNADARVRVGSLGDTYASLEKIFVGKIKSPTVSDIDVTFQLVDSREGRLQSIPPEHYEATTYLNIDLDAIGLPIPVLFGQVTNITPIQIDTSAHKFKVTQTHFGSTVYEQQALDAVYLKGVALVVGVDYTADLHNGEFTLTDDPGDAEVTCDAKGIKDGFDFTTGAATGVYSENVADHLFFSFHILNDIPVSDFNLDSFLELQTVRTQKVAWYLDQDTATIDFNRLLQQTSLYHFLPLLDGTFAARYYRKTVPTGTLELRDYDHKGYRKMRPDEGVFRDIFLQYAKDPTTGVYKQLINTEASTQNRYRKKDPYTVQTALRDDSEAASVLAFYVELLKAPPTKIEDEISMIGKALIPTDKLYVNREIIADGHTVKIAEDEVYVILETRRNLQGGRVGIVAQLDSTLAIYTVHADSPHQDVPHEDHSDTVHEDSSHGNSHTDVPYADHTDDTHSNVSHQDIDYHEDVSHDDMGYKDYEDVSYHIDVAHADVSYTDHDDVAYHDHPHVDTGHVDHTDTVHTDTHTDVTHIDSEV